MDPKGTRKTRMSHWTVGGGLAVVVVLLGGLQPAGRGAQAQGGAQAGAQAAAAPDGGALYRAYCASCHGESGRGDGPVALALRTPPTDLTRLTQRNGDVFPADRVAERIDGRSHVAAHGPSEMPVWGDPLSSSFPAKGEAALNARVAALVEHLRTLQARKSE